MPVSPSGPGSAPAAAGLAVSQAARLLNHRSVHQALESVPPPLRGLSAFGQPGNWTVSMMVSVSQSVGWSMFPSLPSGSQLVITRSTRSPMFPWACQRLMWKVHQCMEWSVISVSTSLSVISYWSVIKSMSERVVSDEAVLGNQSVRWSGRQPVSLLVGH